MSSSMYNKDFKKYLKSNKILPIFNNQPIEDCISQPNDIFTHLLNERILIISGEIDTYLCEFAKASLLYLESIDDNKDITMYINSPGGSVYDGMGLLDVMEYIKPDISTINTGLAASMGAVILCSGTKGKRKALKRSRTMIHQPMGGNWGYMQASDLEIDAKEVNSLKVELLKSISKSTGQIYDKVLQDSDRDYWMTAKEAKKYGMIDEVLIRRH